MTTVEQFLTKLTISLRRDFGWRVSARSYLDVYRRALA